MWLGGRKGEKLNRALEERVSKDDASRSINRKIGRDAFVVLTSKKLSIRAALHQSHLLNLPLTESPLLTARPFTLLPKDHRDSPSVETAIETGRRVEEMES